MFLLSRATGRRCYILTVTFALKSHRQTFLAVNDRPLPRSGLGRLLGRLGGWRLHRCDSLILLANHVLGVFEIEKLHILPRNQLHGHAGEPPSLWLPTQRPDDLIRFFAALEFFGPNAADMGPAGIVGQDL